MSNASEDNPAPTTNDSKKLENHKQQFSRDVVLGGELWIDGLICAFEFVRGHRKTLGSRSSIKIQSVDSEQPGPVEAPKKLVVRDSRNSPLLSDTKDNNSHEYFPPTMPRASDEDFLEVPPHQNYLGNNSHGRKQFSGNYWIPIGWARISELLQTVQVDAGWASQPSELTDDEEDITVADVAAPYWEHPVGPTWWCHVDAGHPFINAWLSNAQWLHPAINIALRDESKLISERMKHLFYEVPVRVAGGLLFELLGQSAGNPTGEDDDIPIVLRSWQAQNFLFTALHVKGSSSDVNVLGISEVQELLAAGGNNVPRTIHEVIALLACRLARWDDRLFRKYIFGTADEVELKFMNRSLTITNLLSVANRRTHEDMHLFSIILNQEIRRLSNQVIRVKWSLHAREEIVFELLQHLRGPTARSLLEDIRKSTREMIQEQEAVRGRLFTIQDVMQSTVRAWLQDQSLRVQHNLGVFGGCGLVLSIITGLFGINVDGIPGADQSPHAFAIFSAGLFLLGVIMIVIGLVYLGLKKPVHDEQVHDRQLELEQLVRLFQQEAESHAQVRKTSSQAKMPSSAADIIADGERVVLVS